MSVFAKAGFYVTLTAAVSAGAFSLLTVHMGLGGPLAAALSTVFSSFAYAVFAVIGEKS